MLRKLSVLLLLAGVSTIWAGWTPVIPARNLELSYNSSMHDNPQLYNLAIIKYGESQFFVRHEEDAAIISALHIAMEKNLNIDIEYSNDANKYIGNVMPVINLRIKEQ